MSQCLDDTPATAGVARAQAATAAVRAGTHELYLAVAQIAADGDATAAGYRSTTRFLQDALRINPAEAARLVERAALLTPRLTLTGQPLPPTLPATAAASAAGLLGDGHLGVITDTMQRLSRVSGMDPDTLADAEQVLGHYAGMLAPAGLAKVARRLVDKLDEDGAAPDESPEPDDELHLLRRRDGSLALKGHIAGVADAEMIVEVFDALSTPAGPDDSRTQPQRFAEALKELVAQAASPTGIATDAHHEHNLGDDGADADTAEDADDGDADDGDADADESRVRAHVDLDQRAADAANALHELPHAAAARSAGCPKITVAGRALLAVTIDHRWLQAQIGHGLLDSDRAVDPATARRIACDSGVVPMVLGSHSEPLDVGRLSYTVPEGMRRALHVRDGGCSFPGCSRRPKRCHAHHVRHWIDNGETKLDNLTLLCVWHHRLVHHSGWEITMVDGRPWYRPPACVDPQRRSRPGGRFPVPDTA